MIMGLALEPEVIEIGREESALAIGTLTNRAEGTTKNLAAVDNFGLFIPLKQRLMTSLILDLVSIGKPHYKKFFL